MATATQRALPSFDPVTARGEFWRRQIATRRKKETVGDDLQATRYPLSATNSRATSAEVALSSENRFAAQQQRMRIQHATKTRLPQAPVASFAKEAEEADNDIRGEEDNEQTRQEQNFVVTMQNRIARAVEKTTEEEERLSTTKKTFPGESTLNDAKWGLIFQGSGTVDMAMEDGGISFVFGTVGSIYQLLLTIFPAFNEKMNGGAMNAVGKVLPQKFNLRTFHGWGQLVDTAVLCIWIFVILGLIAIALAVCFAIFQDPTLGIRVWLEMWGGALGLS